MTRRGLILAAGLLVAASPAWAQRDGYVVRRPVAPSLEALDRLNLKMAWSARIPKRFFHHPSGSQGCYISNSSVVIVVN